MLPEMGSGKISGDGFEHHLQRRIIGVSVHHGFFSIVRINQLKIPGIEMNHELSVRADGTASAIRESMVKFHELNYKPMPRAEIALLDMSGVLLWH